ncbi:hypothetical protein [Thermococcus sp.]|uniref:hypothetical protein n=1 Tax=Thermococcus sp. TaxID=35749 RepID=UPI002622043E|nr:hypothetical protein [Thermococcus sp.]
MKTKAALLLFLLLFSSVEFISGTPYWLKPGSQLVYFANGTTSNAHGGIAYYQNGNCTVNLGFQSVRVVFKVVDVSNDWATINVTVTLYGDKSLRWPYSDVDAYYPANCTPGLPKPINTTIYSPRENISLVWADYGTKLILHGVYKVHLASGVVYSMSGRPYGHTLLFGLYPISKTSYVVLDGKRLTFDKVKILNSTTYAAYYRNFTGPNIFLRSEPANFTDPGGSVAFIRAVVVFNPGDDLTVGFMGVAPDLGASVGINVIAIGDNTLKSLDFQVSGEEVNRAIPPGVLLYDVSVPKTQDVLGKNSHQPQVVPPRVSNLWITGAVVSLLLLAGVFLVKKR